MRVALFTETFLPKVDGIVTVTCLLLDHLAACGVETMLFCPRLGPIERYGATPVDTTPGLPFPPYPDLRLALPTRATLRRLRQFAPDVVHFIHPSVYALAAYAVTRRMGLPALVSYHLDYGVVARHFRIGPFTAGFIEPAINLLTRRILDSADYALAPSQAVRARLHDEIGVRAEIGLWRRGVDAERFHPRHASPAMRARLSGGELDAPLLLYVGRLSSEKQIDHIRPALECVPGARLALVGDGPARADLERHFAGLPVIFTGYLSGDALYQAYASADLFVFPSAVESFGLVVLEAMAAGLPVVAARVGGVAEVVRPGETGYIFSPGDTGALAEGVAAIAADRARTRAMGRAARAFAETQAWPAMMDEVIGHYARLAAGQ